MSTTKNNKNNELDESELLKEYEIAELPEETQEEEKESEATQKKVSGEIKETGILAKILFAMLMITSLTGIIGLVWVLVDVTFNFQFRTTFLSLDPSMMFIVMGFGILVFLIIIALIAAVIRRGSIAIMKIIDSRIKVIKEGTQKTAKIFSGVAGIFTIMIAAGVGLYYFDLSRAISEEMQIARSIGYWIVISGGFLLYVTLLIIGLAFLWCWLYKYFSYWLK